MQTEQCFEPLQVVAKWCAHRPLVLEVLGTIPVDGEEKFGAKTRFPYFIHRDDISLKIGIGGPLRKDSQM